MSLFQLRALCPVLVCIVFLLNACTDDDILDPIAEDEQEEVADNPEDDNPQDDNSDGDTADDNADNPDDMDNNDGSDDGSTDDGTTDDGGNGDEMGNGEDCNDPGNFVFSESNGLINVEFEDAVFTDDWELQTSEAGFTGDGSIVWTGNQFFSQPGTATTTFTLRIQNPGTYRFIWRSAVTIGNNGTEHNDTWLRFADADNFFGDRNGSRVFPAGVGKTPTPEGASSDGWFKVFRSGNDLEFKWQASTSDNDAHDIFVTFDNPGEYTMEISARSSGHAIDRFVLFNSDLSLNEAIDASNSLSEISCSN